MISVIITAWKEEGTIGQAIRNIANREFSGMPENFEILLACPDEPTKIAAEKVVEELGIKEKFIYVKDEGKGKPAALNMLMKKAKGDIWIFTDGDVWFGKRAVAELIRTFSDNSDIQLVTGRPKSADPKTSMMGYFGNLLADAAHHKRMIELTKEPAGRTTKFIKKIGFFPVSGYIYAMKASPDFEFPEDTLVDDAYVSYVVRNKGGKIAYAPEALVYVKYPTNLKDYFKQKKRSTGGYVQLWEYGVVTKSTKTRSLKKELEYFWFPIKYAKNLRELFWSFMLYPIRLWLWVMIFWERRIIKKDFVKTWSRIESTK